MAGVTGMALFIVHLNKVFGGQPIPQEFAQYKDHCVPYRSSFVFVLWEFEFLQLVMLV